MKLSAKPISSPGRAEKYPPPLMRFLRTNGGSRSRGRSRSSPMFIRKKNTNATSIETQQEPTSPKVTCMGQVRVKRSTQSKTPPGKPKNHHRCIWIRKLLFCTGEKLKPKCLKIGWASWVALFHAGSNRRSKKREDNNDVKIEQESKEAEEEEEEAKVFVSSAISPPKNAFLLTRSRSAPYRSSSLASRFWGSPLGTEETEQKQSTYQESESPTSKTESFCGECYEESRLDQESERKLSSFVKEFEGPVVVSSIRERIIMKSANIEEMRRGDGVTVRPLILTRSKSEPARTAAEKLDPEISFWKTRRLGFS